MKSRKPKQLHILTNALYGVAFLLIFTATSAVFVFTILGAPIDNPKGWFWNAYEPQGSSDSIGLGWTSLNCLNDFDNDGFLENRCEGANPYGLSINDGGDGLDGLNDNVQGCAWSSEYGWVCFNGGPGKQCDTGNATHGAACSDLDADGVAIKIQQGECSIAGSPCSSAANCPGTETCDGEFYYLDSPTHTGVNWDPLTSDTQHATILSLYTEGPESYLTFPFTPLTLVTPSANDVIGCFGCDPSTGQCDACLNTSFDAETVDNPNPNLLCWDCGNAPNPCAIREAGGSCSLRRSVNSCPSASCGGCTSFTGVVVNQTQSGEYEMCGWAYHGYSGGGSSGSREVIVIDDDPSIETGKNVSLAMPSDFLPVISYSAQDPDDSQKWKVKVAKCGDPDCQIKVLTFIETIDVQRDTAIAVGSDGFPVIAYSNSSNQVKVAKCDDPACLSVTTPNIIHTAGASIGDIAIVIDAANHPVIAFDAGALYVAHCTDDACNALDPATPISLSSGSGKNLSMTIGADTLPVIVHYDSVVGDVKVTHCNTEKCDSRTTSQLDSTGAITSVLSIAQSSSDGFPIIAYADDVSGSLQLKVAKCSNALCSASSPTTLSGDRAVDYISITMGSDGLPIISAAQTLPTAGLMVIKCGNDDCTNIAPIQIPDPGPGIGQWPSIGIGADNNPVIAYSHNSTIDALKMVRCTTASCGSSSSRGLGWTAVNAGSVGGLAYIRSEGSIASGKSIYSPKPPPVNQYNAAYILEAGGTITNFFSRELENFLYSERGADVPSFLQQGTNQPGTYGNVLGRLDYDGLITVAAGSENKYGSTIVAQAPGDQLPLSNNALDNRVFHWNASETITGDNFYCQDNKSGAGILIIDGDLTITGNVGYDACDTGVTINKVSEVASPVWIVRGDVIIDPDVTEIAGTFVVLGDGTPASCPTSLDISSQGCGRFSSGSGPLQLTISGAVLARQFKLDRSFSSILGPSEKFVADGRLQANTPAGLIDFSKSVPRFNFGF